MEQQESQPIYNNEIVQNRQQNPPISPQSQNSIEQQIKSNNLPIEEELDSPQALYQIKQPISNQEIIDNVPQVPKQGYRTEPILREEKTKKRKVRAYVQDFTDYLPQSLIIVNKTVIPALVRTGERYQVHVPNSPPMKSLYRPMEQWLVWKGSSNPELRPSQQQLLRFKELLGQNRTQQQFIHIKERLSSNSWREVLQIISRSKGEMRRIYHTAQRNRG